MSQLAAGYEKSLLTAVGSLCSHSFQHCQVTLRVYYTSGGETELFTTP